jgi:hypothetical protein
MDINSLEKMSDKNKRSYVERFGNVMMRNSKLKATIQPASMLNKNI